MTDTFDKLRNDLQKEIDARAVPFYPENSFWGKQKIEEREEAHIAELRFAGDEITVALKRLTCDKYQNVEYNAFRNLLNEVSLFKLFT